MKALIRRAWLGAAAWAARASAATASLGVAAAAMAAVAVVACSPAGPRNQPAEDREPQVRIAPVADLATFRLPLDPYLMNSTNLATSTKAESVLAERCLRRFGLEYRLPAPSSAVVVGAQRRYGLADEATARARGYHVAEPPRVEAEQPSAAVETVLSGRGQNSFAGQPVPEGGCIGEARRRLAEGAPAVPNERLATELAWEGFKRTGRDSRVRQVYARWSDCMTRAGHRYADPLQANDDPEFRAAEPTPRELAVATADVTCKKEVGLIDVVASVETAYQQEILKHHASALAAVKANIEHRERTAAAVLAS
jgi:hypothetical protein